MQNNSRRNFLKGIVAGVSTPYLLSTATLNAKQDDSFLDEHRSITPRIDGSNLMQDDGRVFDLSVASGDPTPYGVILWTHINPSFYRMNEALIFQVALDEAFQQIILEGTALPDDFSAARDHTVKIDLDGQLSPNKKFYYRFIYRSYVSNVGRCRTLASSDQDLTSVKFAVLTCQDYTNGYYSALGYLADDDSVEFVLHLGDFIYESVGDPSFQDLPFEDRILELPSGKGQAHDVNDFRHLYKQYRRDPFLRRAMERHTWIMTCDDHETANDCYWDYENDTLGCPDHPFANASLDARRQLKIDSQRAWAEYTPTRVQINEDRTHPFDFLTIYRSFAFGDLAKLVMIDTRTYRSAHPCGEGRFGERYIPRNCNRNYESIDQTMLGQTQREWLVDQFAFSNCRWNVLGNQTYMGRLGIDVGPIKSPLNVDAWDGYEAERNMLMSEVKSNRIENFVVLTGDLHTNIASEIKQNYKDTRFWKFDNYRGVEFMTPSVTSAGLVDILLKEQRDNRIRDFLLQATSETVVKVTNPHIKGFNSLKHGYSTIEFREGYCEWTAYGVDKNIYDSEEIAATMRFRKYEVLPWLTRMPC